MYIIEKGAALSLPMIEKYIELYKTDYLPKLLKNKRYYDSKNDLIMNRVFEDITKLNNKIATSWSKYISTLISGYFMGKPVTYDTQDKIFIDYVTNKVNKEIIHNQMIERDCSIYGIGVELVYLNEQKEVSYDHVDPLGVIAIYDNGLPKQLQYVIHYTEITDILDNSVKRIVDVYSQQDVSRYEVSLHGLRLVGTVKHLFREVPINIFYNNKDMRGDSECVHTLIDGYDLALSDTANFRQELNDSYLVFKNTNLETDDIITMKERRIISIEDADQGSASDVSWLNKDSNDSENENYKARISEDIKRFSFVADIESAKSHTTATSAKIGLMGIEQICAEKETYFREGLLKRARLICSIEGLWKDLQYPSDLTITFVRNIPVDLSVLGDTITKFASFVSKRTLLKQIPFVNDVEGELASMEAEKQLGKYEEDNFLDDEELTNDE